MVKDSSEVLINYKELKVYKNVIKRIQNGVNEEMLKKYLNP